MPFRARYIALAHPAWPPTSARLAVIYSTVARAIRSPSHAQKVHVLDCLQNLIISFDAGYNVHLATQMAFDAWHRQTIATLRAIPFAWTDANGMAYDTLSFGAAQKFLNLAIKDWWALSPNGTNPVTQVHFLHGPLDNIVYSHTSRFCTQLPSLHNPRGIPRSYVYFLIPHDYEVYQAQLLDLARRLSTGLGLPYPARRIEVEQLLWGWI